MDRLDDRVHVALPRCPAMGGPTILRQPDRASRVLRRQAAIAIENVRLFEAEKQRTLALAHANRDLAEREAKIRPHSSAAIAALNVKAPGLAPSSSADPSVVSRRSLFPTAVAIHAPLRCQTSSLP